MRPTIPDWNPVEPGDATFRFSSGLSVFFPAYNDAPSIGALVTRTMELLHRVADEFEVIVVNDGSSDGTGEVLERLRLQYEPKLRVVTHAQNRGYGGALQSGFAAATKEFVFYTDGDGQYDPAELETFLRAVKPDTVLVNGYKKKRHDPWHRIAIGALYNRFARWLFRIGLRDIDCDFRLIRHSALDQSHLRSSGGSICVELVRSLELRGQGVIELPVSHYPRLHGSSQFFRLPSLATTFVQLLNVYCRLVLTPLFLDTAPVRATRRTAFMVLLAVTLLSALAYGPTIRLPFISDSYIQIQLGRDLGPMNKWPELAADVLYRYRATSVVFTYWTEKAFGYGPAVFHLSALLLHVFCSLLVFALGTWRAVGWRISAVAACYFAVSQRHSEAVIWYAALPELLVFLFSLLSFLCWIRFVQQPAHRALTWLGTLSFFVLALLSKESAVAVVPLCGLAVLLEGKHRMKRFAALVPIALLVPLYFGLAWADRGTHLHFNDGTFGLHAPFLNVILRSGGRLMGVWGTIALCALALWKPRRWRLIVGIALVWMAITLLPYSFILYMPRVPSRHTYFASAGLAILVAAGFLALVERSLRSNRPWLIPLLAGIMVTHQVGYLWTYKYHQYSQRAEPTEHLLRVARTTSGPIYARCFPYALDVAEHALRVGINESKRPFILLHDGADAHPDAINYCNSVAYTATSKAQ